MALWLRRLKSLSYCVSRTLHHFVYFCILYTMRIFLPFILFLCSSLLHAQDTVIVKDFSESSHHKHAYSDHSVLSGGRWFKLKIQQEGIYKITYSDLVQQGIDIASVDPRNIKIYGNGGGMLPEANWIENTDDLVENAIYIEGEDDGVFDPDDYILFFGQSTVIWSYDTIRKHFVHTANFYSDYTYYFLNFSEGYGKRITLQPSVTGTPDYIITESDDYQVHEKDSVNLLKSGKEWYGEYFDAIASHTFGFTFPGIDLSSPAWMRTNIAARSYEQTSFDITADHSQSTINVSAIPGTPTSDYARYSEDTLQFIPDDDNIDVTITETTQSSIGWLNFIEMNALRSLSFVSPQMQFRKLSCVGSGNISEFRIADATSNVKIWDITDIYNIKEQQNTFAASEIRFTIHTDTLKQFIAFDGSGFYSPVFVEKVQNQDLHGLQQPDMVIVTYPSFKTQAERVAAIHETNDNLSTVIVTPQEIYNEFSSGAPDLTAIRNFMRMFYERADSTENFPKYLLLFGDASYDYKDRLESNTNYVPTYESYNSLVPVSSYLTDDYYGILELNEGFYSNGTLEIGIGRLPAKDEEEAKALVDKIETYISRYSIYSETNGCNTYTSEVSGDWRNVLCFVADDEDNNLHIEQAEVLATSIDSSSQVYNLTKIYLDAYKQQITSQGASYPDVNTLINEQVRKGALIINYTGHGGETGWAQEGVLKIADVESWTNLYNMPLFITATCEFSRFDEPSRTSAGELVLLNARGGGMALMTTTRVGFAYSNFNLNKSICRRILKKDSSNLYPRLGDIIRNAKIDNGSIVNIRHFVLLGDPALRLSYPAYGVATTEINGHTAGSTNDTLKSNSKVTVKGYIEDGNGQKMVNFNGTIYPTVFDKKITQITLANDPQSLPYTFQTQENIIFKGKSSVVNGDFEFSFVVPRDISPDYGQAKISYFAKDSTSDAADYYENQRFIIGGIDTLSAPDDEGPGIQLFFNSTSFASGGITDENPILIALLEDTTGIQYTGFGLGHDITATLDGETEQEYILNDYFMPDLDSYKKGMIVFPFKSLSLGEHTLKLKAWDVADNSSESTITFTVTKTNPLSLKNIYNYPNPFKDNTCFYFEHNQPCCDLDVEINIYSVTGILVKTIRETVSGKDFISIGWDGCNDSGYKLNSGVYIYKIKVITAANEWLESANRLIILR